LQKRGKQASEIMARLRETAADLMIILKEKTPHQNDSVSIIS